VKAHFIDGHTSKKREAELRFMRDCAVVSYLDDEGIKKESIWNVAGIHKLDVRTSNKTLRYGEFPHQVLEFESDADFDAFVGHFPRADFHQSHYNKFAALGHKGIVVAIAGVIAVSAVFFFWGAPWLAERIAQMVPMEYEEYIGQHVQQSFLYYSEVDSARSEQIQEFYDHLGYESDYNIRVVVVDQGVKNAFALPGGFIVVYAGLLDELQDETELAGLLAHEVSHVNEKHSLRMMSRDLAMYILLASVTGDFGGFSSVIIENSEMISGLSNSRDFEKEADMEGLELMIKSGIDPEGMVSLFQLFDRDFSQESIDKELDILDTSNGASPEPSHSSWEESAWETATEVLSTHPSPSNRIQYLSEEIARHDQEFAEKQDLARIFNELTQ